jgi:hypothetical protein
VYTLWGPQIGVGVANNNFKGEISPAYSVGLIGDWLAFGDYGGFRLATNFVSYQGDLTDNRTIKMTEINALDIPLSIRWTYIGYSHFNAHVGTGIQFHFENSIKNNLYLTYGIDYTIYSKSNKRDYYIGINCKQGLKDIDKNQNNQFKPVIILLNLGIRFFGTGFK